jgi:hypothetical protein
MAVRTAADDILFPFVTLIDATQSACEAESHQTIDRVTSASSKG